MARETTGAPVLSSQWFCDVRHHAVYEGPFDLLLHLILKQEVELWEVSLSGIVDAYLTELDRMESLDLDVATEFLLIAATLVELKARRLLPGLEDARARRGAAALRGARPAARPAARVQDVQGRRARPRGADRAAPTAACPAPRAPRSPTAGWRPTRSERSARPRCAPPRCACSRPARAASSTPTTSRRCAPACATRSSRCCACCPSRSR